MKSTKQHYQELQRDLYAKRMIIAGKLMAMYGTKVVLRRVKISEDFLWDLLLDSEIFLGEKAFQKVARELVDRYNGLMAASRGTLETAIKKRKILS